MGAACWRLGAGCLEASGPASGLFTGSAPTFLKCNSTHVNDTSSFGTSSWGYQKVQNIKLTCPSKIQRNLKHLREGNLDQPEPEMLRTTQVLLLSSCYQLSFVIKNIYRSLWCREHCKTLSELLLVGQKHSFSNLQLVNLTTMCKKKKKALEAGGNS